MKIIKIIIKSIYRAARGVYRFVLPRCLRKRIYSFTVKASIRFKRSLGFEDPAVLLRYDSYETTICEREDTVRELASVIEKRDQTIKSQAETINEYKMYASSVHEAGKKSGDFVAFKENNIALGEEDVKLIACYLPQFHAIPENDEWWGKGFTEWTNVTKAMPHFAGHYQPHLPLEAFYDLSDINVMKWQVRLAQNYGVHGFMFHYYWFSGRKLLEKPLDNFFAAKADLDFPFCINWANHNWTRVWEAGEKDILLKQSYCEQDDLALISDIARYMKDKRYIRVFGKPLVSIYNAGSLPDPNQTIKIWRDYCRQNGIGEIHIVGMDSDMCNPLNYDFDGAIAQSPHDVSILFHDRLHSDLISKNGSRVCNIYDMKKYIREKMYLTDGREKFYRGLIPTFDNTARRINDAFVFDVSPALYKKWLGDLIVDAKKRFESGNRFVFINAWNEWAEGAHLEPDRRFGYAYLQATADALTLPPDDDTDDTDEPPDDDDPPCEEPGGEVNHIAFYLPQYHPFAENDKWWGDGFTDWVNVKKAAPMFDGHDQPRIPGELGYYDLRQKETIKRQMDMARRYGVYGFCIYYYWFDGKILMETPLKLIMENPELDLPFCLCWANENWSRRWDGKDDDVLLAQRYEKGFAGRFIRDAGVYMKDARYIRVNSKPMLAVYDAGRIPNIEETLREWRAYCCEAKIGEIHILAVDFALPDEAANAGFDGFIEFPPHSLYDENRQTINEQMDNLSERFCGKVFDYAQIVKSREYMNTRLPNTHKGIFLSWDNTARRKDNPTIFHRFSIEQYSRWLRGINIYTKKHFDAGNRFVFINAWNEWAEGTYLEPDALYGYAALEEIAAVTKTKSRRNKSIIVAGHDANLYGAQLLSLNIVRQLKEVFGYDVYVIVKHGGSLAGQFKETSKGFLDLSGFDMRDGKLAEKDGRTAKEEITRFIKSSGAKKAICNTSVVGDILEILTENGIECISLIHETENMLYKYSGTEILQSIINHAKHIVFACEYVKKSVSNAVPIPEQKSIILPQGLYNYNPYVSDLNSEHLRNAIIEKYGLADDSKIVLNVSNGDHRKGIDLFVRCAALVPPDAGNVLFLWVGGIESQMKPVVDGLLKDLPSHIKVVIEEATPDIMPYYMAADLFLLTSREDPFPSVVLEAMNASLPVVAFEGGGGYAEIISEETGKLVPMEDTAAMAVCVGEFLNGKQKTFQKSGQTLIFEKFGFTSYIYALLKLLGENYKKVSVIIPNYNYAHYLKGRIDSVLGQTYPVFEIILIDDSSGDNSLEIMKEYKFRYPLTVRVIENAQNSGNVFSQWELGIKAARGDYIWIAESDDLCESGLLESLMQKMAADEDIIMGYTQSNAIDESGDVIFDDYLEYTDDVDKEKWKADYIADASEEIEKRLSIKNTIPNVSAVVFKNRDFTAQLREAKNYKVAGDWRFYVEHLKNGGKVFYSRKILNHHRRHDGSVTKTLNAKQHFDEITELQDYVYALTRNEIYYGKAMGYRSKVRGILGLLKQDFDLPQSLLQDHFPKNAGNPKIAVHAHIYYTDLADEIIENINHIPFKYDCYVSTDTKEKKEKLAKIFSASINAGHIHIGVYENRGRDVAPLLAQMSDVIDDYDYICHIHSKGSYDQDYSGESWRAYLFKNLLGSGENIKSILSMFFDDPALGLIFPKTYPPIAHHYSYGSNRENMIELFQRLGQNTKLPENLAFPSGNMFWAKTKAIRDIFTLRLKSSDFPEEKGQIDATLSHAIERSWVLLAESNGYKHREVSAEGF